MTPQSYIFMGRYGAGKGTQADLLMKKLKEKQAEHPIIYMETGKEFRKFNEGTSYTARIGKQIVDSGRLMPEYMCVYLWGRLIVENFTGKEHLVFDGTPRKLLEAKLLEGLFPFYGLEKPWVIYLDVEHDESHKRLLLRAKTSGRADDHTKAMEARKVAYEADVVPSIDYYRTSPNVRFLDVDGERSIEDIHADIVKLLGLA
jgi:adenylate kinase family enzyme